MKNLTLTLALLFSSLFSINAQSIRIIQKETQEKYPIRGAVPEKIIETITEFKKNGTSTTKKETIEFSVEGDTITQTRFDGNQRDLWQISVYNPNNLKTYSKTIRGSGNNEKTFIINYSYNGMNLTEIHNQEEVKRINHKANTYGIITTDSLGLPIRSDMYNHAGRRYLYQIVTPDYPSNRLIFEVYDSLDNRVRKETHFIQAPVEYNEQGDPVFYPDDPTVGNRRFFRARYRYDKQGNWTFKQEWLIRKKDDVVVEERLVKTTKRKIHYRKE